MSHVQMQKKTWPKAFENLFTLKQKKKLLVILVIIILHAQVNISYRNMFKMRISTPIVNIT